jgi:predicted  nucleic acid-binding Zn-ribbon protein
MLETIEKLLILQDRDQKIRRVKGELDHIEPERQTLKEKAASTQAGMERAKFKLKEIETARKNLELEVQGKKDLINKYANQQLQTRKNEEYRALALEIETCKKAIFKIEDEEISLMEQGEGAQKEIVRATQAAGEAKKLVDDQLAQLATREKNLSKELADLASNRELLAEAVETGARARYERLLKSKGEHVVVGVQRGVCGGCHMKLQPQLLVMCQADKEIVSCSNCGRILYYTRDMDLAVVD